MWNKKKHNIISRIISSHIDSIYIGITCTMNAINKYVVIK